MDFFHAVDQGVTANRSSQDLQLIDSELLGALINATAGKGFKIREKGTPS